MMRHRAMTDRDVSSCTWKRCACCAASMNFGELYAFLKIFRQLYASLRNVVHFSENVQEAAGLPCALLPVKLICAAPHGEASKAHGNSTNSLKGIRQCSSSSSALSVFPLQANNGYISPALPLLARACVRHWHGSMGLHASEGNGAEISLNVNPMP